MSKYDSVTGSGGVSSSKLDDVLDKLNKTIDLEDEINKKKVTPNVDSNPIKEINKNLDGLKDRLSNQEKSKTELFDSKRIQKTIQKVQTDLDFLYNKIINKNQELTENQLKTFVDGFKILDKYEKEFGVDLTSKYSSIMNEMLASIQKAVSMFATKAPEGRIKYTDVLEGVFKKMLEQAEKDAGNLLQMDLFDANEEITSKQYTEQSKELKEQKKAIRENAQAVAEAERQKRDELRQTVNVIKGELKNALQGVMSEVGDAQVISISDDDLTEFQQKAYDLINLLQRMGVEVEDVQGIVDNLLSKVYVPKSTRNQMGKETINDLQEKNKSQEVWIEQLEEERDRYGSRINELALEHEHEVDRLQDRINGLEKEKRDLEIYNEVLENENRELQNRLSNPKNNEINDGNINEKTSQLKEEIDNVFNDESADKFVDLLAKIVEYLEQIKNVLGSVDDNNGFNNIINNLNTVLQKLDEVYAKIGTGIYNVTVNKGVDKNALSTDESLKEYTRKTATRYTNAYDKLVKRAGSEELLFAYLNNVLSPEGGIQELMEQFSSLSISRLETSETKIYRLIAFFKLVRQAMDSGEFGLDLSGISIPAGSDESFRSQLRKLSGISKKKDESEVIDLDKTDVGLDSVIDKLNEIKDILETISNKDYFGDIFDKLLNKIDDISVKFQEIFDSKNLKSISNKDDLLSGTTTLPSQIDEITQAEDKMGNEAQEATDKAKQGLAEMREEAEKTEEAINDGNETPALFQESDGQLSMFEEIANAKREDAKATEELIDAEKRLSDIPGQMSIDDFADLDKQLDVSSSTEEIDKATEAIKQEGESAEKSAQQKKEFVDANKKVAESGSATADGINEATEAIKKEGKVVSESKIDVSDFEKMINVSKDLKKQLGGVVDVYQQIQKDKDGEDKISYRLVGKNGYAWVGQNGDVLKKNIKTGDDLSQEKAAQKELKKQQEAYNKEQERKELLAQKELENQEKLEQKKQEEYNKDQERKEQLAQKELAQQEILEAKKQEAYNKEQAAKEKLAIKELEQQEKLEQKAQEKYNKEQEQKEKLAQKELQEQEKLEAKKQEIYNKEQERREKEAQKELENQEKAEQKKYQEYKKQKESEEKQALKDLEKQEKTEKKSVYQKLSDDVKEYIRLKKLAAQDKLVGNESAKLNVLEKTVYDTIDKIKNTPSLYDELELNKVTKGLDTLGDEIQRIQNATHSKLNDKFFGLQDRLKSSDFDLQYELDNGKHTDDFINKINELRQKLQPLLSKEQGVDIITDKEIKQANELLESIRQLRKEGNLTANKQANENSIQKGLAQINSILSGNTKSTFRRTDVYKDLVELQTLFKSFDASRPQSELAELMTSLLKAKARFEELDETVKGAGFFQTFTERLRGINAQLLAQYFSWHDIIRYGRTMVSTIISLDSSLLDLRKTTTMNATELDNFYHSASDVAKGLGVTTNEIITQASAWSRLNNIGPLCGNI